MHTSFFCPTATHTFSTNKNGSLDAICVEAAQLNKTVVSMQQVHGSSFVWLDDTLTASTETLVIPGFDGVLTANRNMLLTVKTADCLPILLYHPSGIVGTLHAGRKSTQLGLLQKTLNFLKNEKKVETNVYLWFGPAICKKCYQIDRDPDTHFDLRSENTKQALTVFSSSKVSIKQNDDCTLCQKDTYHSYRAEGENVKMNYFGIALK